MRNTYGYNGKEKDNEIKGEGTSYDYGFRIYDARVARFFSIDPLSKSYPWYTPYQFAGNTPIWAVDLDGLEPSPATYYKFWNWTETKLKLIDDVANQVWNYLPNKVNNANKKAEQHINEVEKVTGIEEGIHYKFGVCVSAYFQEFGDLTDIGDGYTLQTGMNPNQTVATSFDKGVAVAGLIIPMINSKFLKEG